MEQIVYPYIPNTTPEVKAEMMREVEAKDEREIFEVIPDHLLYHDFKLPEPILDECSLKRHTAAILNKNAGAGTHLCFLGAGCAPHYVPAVVDEVLGRGEFYTAYTSDLGDQGRGQLQFEYQSQMAELLDMDVIAFPQYDGGSSLGHAFRMAGRISGRKKVLYPASINPMTLNIARNYLTQIDGNYCDLVEVKYSGDTGLLDLEDLAAKLDDQTAAVMIENPTFLGIIEIQAEEIGSMAKKAGAEFIVYGDPISMGVMEAPGSYGATIACGDIHSIGIHMFAGAGVGGYVMVKDDPKYAFQLKDMMYGASPTTVEGEIGFSFEASFDRTSYEIREQCAEYTGTSAGLWTATAGVYLAVMGPAGMEEVGTLIMQRARYAAKKLSAIKGVSLKYSGPVFKEFVLDLTASGVTPAELNKKLLAENIIGGYDLTGTGMGLDGCMLVCVTEIHSKADIDQFVQAVERGLM
ncbi:aminomethyl-transferring glycine dehydrogenase subunit GcvPA [Bacilliculturomica massiliensis]|uniref:aminomethyl-transferring glycine dehydrogenase subunit GcvPA n=1 Tax=Bacilliculturomica massiliensis TaxID=1917867 RepID=UPI0010303A1C|nr:aminomethyl-transferring glycine dehydrogenase subunit GcvPA [Bacilliculturomica massiliensis]